MDKWYVIHPLKLKTQFQTENVNVNIFSLKLDLIFVHITGSKFDLECWSGKSKVKLTKNGSLEITYIHAKEFHLAMEWNLRPLTHYAHVSETNLKYSLDTANRSPLFHGCETVRGHFTSCQLKFLVFFSN